MTFFILSLFFLDSFMNLSVAICPPPPPSIHQREIRKRPKPCKKIFFLPSQLFLIYVRGPLLWIFGDGQAGFLHGGRTNHVYLIGKMVTIHGKVSQSKKFMKWKFPNGIFCPLFFRQRLHFKKKHSERMREVLCRISITSSHPFRVQLWKFGIFGRHWWPNLKIGDMIWSVSWSMDRFSYRDPKKRCIY